MVGGGKVVRGSIVDGKPFDQHLGGWHCLQFSIWVSNSSICSVQSKKLYFLYILREASFSTVVVFAPGPEYKEHTEMINKLIQMRLYIILIGVCRVYQLFSILLRPSPPIMSLTFMVTFLLWYHEKIESVLATPSLRVTGLYVCI